MATIYSRDDKTGPQKDCPLTDAAQNVPGTFSTMQEFRDEQARRLYRHACAQERQIRELRKDIASLRAHLEDIAHPTLIETADSLRRIARGGLKARFP